eukprot:1192121-Pyramimonas_sp.AAC.1
MSCTIGGITSQPRRSPCRASPYRSKASQSTIPSGSCSAGTCTITRSRARVSIGSSTRGTLVGCFETARATGGNEDCTGQGAGARKHGGRGEGRSGKGGGG